MNMQQVAVARPAQPGKRIAKKVVVGTKVFTTSTPVVEERRIVTEEMVEYELNLKM
jgi:hypothetical protein